MRSTTVYTAIKLSLLTGALVFSIGCQPTANVNESSLSSRSLASKSAVIERASIVGPEVGHYYEPVSYSVSIPANMVVSSVSWDLGDGTTASGASVSHQYAIGLYVVKASLVSDDGSVTVLSKTVNILDVFDGLECLVDVTINAPGNAEIGESVPANVVLPACFSKYVTSVELEFGDSSSVVNAASAVHAYSTAGMYTIKARIFSAQSNNGPFLSLSKDILITEPVIVDPPAACVLGEERSSYGNEYVENVSCGLDGKKAMTYKLKTVEKCEKVNNVLAWVEVSKTPELVSEGQCLGQSCKLSDGSILGDKQSRTFYSSQSPAGTCDSVASTRTCNNGVLGGSDQHTYLSCNNGCGDFGPNGTVKTGVVVGEVQVALTCSFGETGFFDIFNKIEDQACNQGQIVSSNVRQGTIKSAGMCPVYSWEATDQFSACSADCGGTQSRIYSCRDNKGVVSDESRCVAAKPVETRVCDGNPDAVRRSDVSVVEEDGSSSATCPKNQIGVIAKTREVTTTKVYACINHSVQLESETVTNGPWVTENYCRDYVAHRCSQDSLSTTQARQRYAWMQKCRATVPMIDDFLKQTEGVVKDGHSFGSATRPLYATFMDRKTKPEKPWIAPKVAGATCDIPATVYIASVCVASCATPEQQILAEVKANRALKYVPFVEALTGNLSKVATLSSNSTLQSHKLEQVKVEQWITEMLDTDHVIVEFKMKSGRSLRLTENHPLLASDGSMRLAESFKTGESLVQLGGKLDQIVSINKTNYHGKVYNLFVKSSDPIKNIVVTNGYLNGSAFYQNEGAENMNRELLRSRLTRGVFGK